MQNSIGYCVPHCLLCIAHICMLLTAHYVFLLFVTLPTANYMLLMVECYSLLIMCCSSLLQWCSLLMCCSYAFVRMLIHCSLCVLHVCYSVPHGSLWVAHLLLQCYSLFIKVVQYLNLIEATHFNLI